MTQETSKGKGSSRGKAGGHQDGKRQAPCVTTTLSPRGAGFFPDVANSQDREVRGKEQGGPTGESGYTVQSYETEL